ncbi:fatty acid--CoA ligase [Thalassotalea sp. PLHSN55]|uniref:fatty acid--CoA ligase n=1 Tax=Thalassotalea sp. PLHSN55 TaxID=3435888 RepID=UPI003F846B80
MQTKILPSSASAYEYPLLIKRLLTSHQRFEQKNQIVYRGEERFSYAEFNQRVCQLANTLTELGVKAGDTVAVMDWDSHRYLECFFAIPMIGAVLHTVNIRLSPDQILYTMNHAKDDFVLVHEDFLPIAEGIASGLETVKGVITLSDSGQAPSTQIEVCGEYEALIAKADKEYDFPDFDENSVATLFYTTGTTGNPKGVYFSHRQLVLHTMNMVSSLTIHNGSPMLSADSVYMPITPMFHVHAWGIPYVATMLGMQQIYPGRYEPNALAKLIREEKVNLSHCVPTLLQMVLQSDEAKTTDFTGWHVIIGGSPLTSGLANHALDLGIHTYTGYGMSETCPLLSLTRLTPEQLNLPDEAQIPLRIKAGIASNMVDMQIWDANGKPLPFDGETTGEVVVRAPWLTQNYLYEPEKGEELWQGGWLHTGDVACIHADGNVEIKDRIKDVIKTGGEWISSLDLENLISAHDEVAEVAVVGLPDERWGERPHALIVSTSELNSADIEQHLQTYIAQGVINKWAIPKTINFVTDIPKTSVGKIDKKNIRVQLSE